MGYEITLIDDSTEQLDADGYALEGPLTTFFRNRPGRAARLDPWSTRIMSVRTERIACIRSREAAFTGSRSAHQLRSATPGDALMAPSMSR